MSLKKIKSSPLRFALILLVPGLLMIFQNCAPTLKSEEVERSIASLDTEHVDREHGTLETLSKTVVETRAEDLLADRVLLLAQLTAVFGPSTALLDAQGDRIATNMTTFGSPCSLYENFFYEAKDSKGVMVQGAADANRGCAMSNTANALKATVYPQASVVRQAVLGHLCLKLATAPATLAFALKRIEPAGNPEPTADNVVKAFRLFYRNAPQPHDALVQSLQVMMPGDSAERARVATDWSPVLYTICISSGWQLL